MKKVYIGIIVGLIFVGVFVWKFSGQDPQKISSQEIVVSPQGVEILVTRAETEESRVKGLSYQEYLPQHQGMLFVFPQVGIYPFWMKGMQFPLDIVWIDENGVIVDRVLNADPSSYPKTFTPQASAKYVLEINVGVADSAGFFIGGQVIFKNNEMNSL